MDFLDPKKTRRHNFQLMLGYVLVATAIFLASLILILYAYGFRVDKDGELRQRGLVFVSSQPTGANMYVDGVLNRERTNAKLNLPTGTYELKITSEGYTDWQREIQVDGGGVHHFVYPVLLPNELTAQTIDTFSSQPVQVSGSPGKRWMLAQFKHGDSFELFDLNRDIETVSDSTRIDVPASLLSTGSAPAKWEILEWSTNNRHFLAKRFFVTGGIRQFEYILVDTRQPNGSRNLSRELGITPTELVLRDKQPDSYYLYDEKAKSLSVATLDNPVVRVHLRNVLAYKPHGRDILLYATNSGADQGKVRVVLRDGERSYDIRSVSQDKTYLLDLARYDGEWYVAAGAQSDERVYLYQDPVSQIRRSSSGRAVPVFGFNLRSPTKLSFSANAQFILLQNGEAMHVYDAENNRAYRYKVKFPIDGPEKFATWVDGHRLTYVSGGKQVIFEYDDLNRRELTAADKRIGGLFDRDLRYFYSFVPDKNVKGAVSGTLLKATPLRTEEDL